MVRFSEETIGQYRGVVENFAKAANRPVSEVTRRDMKSVVQSFDAMTMKPFVPSVLPLKKPLDLLDLAARLASQDQDATLTQDQVFLKTAFNDVNAPFTDYPGLFVTHIWDGAQIYFWKGLESLLKQWGLKEVKAWFCLFSNSQFHISAASFVSASDEQLLEGEEVASENPYEDGEVYWVADALKTLFEDVAKNSVKFAWFGQTKGEEGFAPERWAWNFPEFRAWLHAESDKVGENFPRINGSSRPRATAQGNSSSRYFEYLRGPRGAVSADVQGTRGCSFRAPRRTGV